ncbi:MAG TPA: hypothetical protein VMR31_03965 [Myxococcota bacterium]|nr:hypothetical protein [Myxococcota bacterium]
MASKADGSKTFSLHWGSGVIEEEVQIETQYTRPTIQLLKFTDGEAKGSYASARTTTRAASSACR